MTATAHANQLPPAREIPSTFFASVRSWWATGEKESAHSEERLLSKKLPSYQSSYTTSPPAPDIPVIVRSSKVELDSPKYYLNTLSIKAAKPSPNAPPPAVMLHGYGAGLGFYFQNFPTMAQWAERRGAAVYALDWLGMGRSARVPFSIRAKKEDIPGRVAEAESFFVDSLEEWRKKMSLEKMTLIGHSLGAYFSVAYALRYPTRVNKLILLSPAGVPHGPETSSPAREITDPQQGGEGGVEPATPGNVAEIKSEQRQEQKQASRTRRVLMYLWEEGWSPFQVVRSSFVLGPMIVGKYSSRRFSGLTEEETRDVHDYIVNITLAKGSGEYCISHILAPGAHARLPLVDRIDELKIPITFVYGDHDWMDPEGGSDSVDKLKRKGNTNAKMYIVKNAGHHVYLDNAKQVNKLLLKELDDIPEPVSFS